MGNKDGDRKYSAYALYISALLLFGTNGVIVSNISLPSAQIVLLRTLIGGVMLTCLVLFFGGFDKESIRKESKQLLLGGICLGLNWVFLFEAYRLLNVSLATLIYYVGPVLVLLFSPILFGEKITRRKLVAVIPVMIGVICITGSIVTIGLNLFDLSVAILSALFYAALIVFNKKIFRTSALQTAAVELDIAFVVVLLYTLLTSRLLNFNGRDLPYILIIGFLNTGLAYLLYFSGLQKLPAQSVALLSYLDPVSAIFFSALILHEVMTPIQVLGAVLIIGGAMLGELKSST